MVKPPYFAVIHQEFKIHVPLESYVIKGNDAIVKCEIPSFVGDLVKISSWVDSSGKEYPATEQFSFGIYKLATVFRHLLFMTPPGLLLLKCSSWFSITRR